jgi:hypothetical protein
MPKRKLIVTGQKPITNLKLKNGGTSTLFEVFATDEHGGYIEESLRAFTELDLGQCLEYEIEPYNHPRYGTSYTLTPPKRETARRIRELEEQVSALLGWAESQGFKSQPALNFRVEGAAAPDLTDEALAAEHAARDPGPEAEPTPAPENPEADEKWGKEAPWSEEDIGPAPEGEITL